MKVFTDYHNGALYKSLHLLFEKRLEFELYRPIGWDWFTNGYWKVAEPYGNAKETIGQYLDINTLPFLPYKNLNGDIVEKNGIYTNYDPENDIEHKSITLEMFKQIEFDFIISTHPAHNWESLLQFQPKAKYIVQLGNEGQTTDWKNVLSSVWATSPKEGQNICYYHQEFDLDRFVYTEPVNHTLIRSFVHLQPEKETFDIYKSNLSEFQMEAYGMGTKLGVGTDLPRQMSESAFGWHLKPADGYGHVIHNWFAVGRPIIVKGSQYYGKTGGLLLEDGRTCIDLEKHTFGDNLNMIRYWSLPDHHKEMCQNVYKKFKEVCNFDSEAERIKTFLSNIL